MKKQIILPVLAIGLLFTLTAFDIPEGWFKAGSHPDSYEMGIEPTSGKDGGSAVTISSVDKKIKGFGTLMTISDPGKYAGNRIRMTAWIKTENVKRWCGIWLRVDKKDSDQSLAFDNMHDGKKNRSIKGDTDWAKYDIVLDVPEDAYKIAYGALLAGTGQVWFDKVEFEIVDKSVPTTGRDIRYKDEPENEDFEE